MKPERIQKTYAYCRLDDEVVVQVGRKRPRFDAAHRLHQLPSKDCLELACRPGFVVLAEVDLTGVDSTAVETVSPAGSDKILVALTRPTLAALTAADSKDEATS
ncbi:MAG: hypothetical protein AAGE94_20180 [Acidobacteriota bacterium]